MREKYLNDSFHGYSLGNFTDSEMSDPSKILLDIVKIMNTCQQELYERVQVSTVKYELCFLRFILSPIYNIQQPSFVRSNMVPVYHIFGIIEGVVL